MITLAVGRMDIDHGKNNFFTDHNALFQTTDLKPVGTVYAGQNWPKSKPTIELNEGLAKPLGQVLDRIALLGHTFRTAEHYYGRLHEADDPDEKSIPFKIIRKVLASVNLTKVTGRYRDDYQPSLTFSKRALKTLALRSEKHHYYNPGLRPDHWEIDLLVDPFPPYAALLLLGQNELNHGLEVTWDFGPLVESGWAKREEFGTGLRPEQQFLIVTEGSSDANILKHALRLYRPHVADFFRFVDMEEGYPFSGTGNLHRFTQGLISIGLQNNAVIIYDNDAEGVSKMNETKRLSLLPHMRVIQLPPHDYFSNFKTVGPNGVGRTDINHKAAAIECYLDLRRPGLPQPIVRWTSFNRELGVYQGELQHKTRYMKDFLGMRQIIKGYKSDRIGAVLNALFSECVSIAEGRYLSARRPETDLG